MKNFGKMKKFAVICLGLASVGSYATTNVNATYENVKINTAITINKENLKLEPLIKTLSQSEVDKVDITYTNKDYIPLNNTGAISCEQENEFFSSANGCSCLITYEENEEGQCVEPEEERMVISQEVEMQTVKAQSRMIEQPQTEFNEGIKSSNVATVNYTESQPEYSYEEPQSDYAYTEEYIEYIEPQTTEDYGSGQSIVDKAMSLVGATGYDCFKVVDEALNYSGWQGSYSNGQEVTLDSLLPGDIIVYPSHYSVYVGNGQAVHGGYNGLNVILGDIVVGKQPYTAYRCF